MEKVRREALTVAGITARTSNDEEMQPERAKIGRLWQELSRRLHEGGVNPAAVYGVYSNFASDERGAYDITVGIPGEYDLRFPERVCLPAGLYLRFVKEGAQPQATIALWQEVWAYFSGDGAPQRTFFCDYEEYVERDKVTVYVGIEEGI